MRIEELHLKNFRCFKELDIQFPESNLAVFIGLNGSGKSAILDAILLNLANYSFFSLPSIKAPLFYNNEDIYFEEKECEIRTVFDFCGQNIHTYSSDYSKNHDSSTFTGDLEENFICLYYNTDKTKNYSLLNRISNETNFNKFLDWFESEENIESELQKDKKEPGYTNPSLDVIRKALPEFLSYISGGDKFDNLRVKRVRQENEEPYKPYLYIDCNDKPLKLSQLSSGENLLIHLVCDIASQLAKVAHNSYPKCFSAIEVLGFNGIVLIDEIELHLHPQWQREVLPALQKTFPNIQFIVTTHSPQVLSRVHRDDIFILKDNKLYKPSSNPIGRDSNDILAEIMEVTKRPKEIQELSDKYFSLLNKNLFPEAQQTREQILKLLDDADPIFRQADALIARKTLLRK